MIYDCFTFFNELDMLEIRLNMLYDYVDYFVIVEGNRTHANKEKEIVLEKNKERFVKFWDKIRYIVVEDWPQYETKWTYEHYQRNCIMRGLQDCNAEDILIISDLDEIPNPCALKRAFRKLEMKGQGIFSLEMLRFEYYLNYFDYLRCFWDQHPKVLTFSELFVPHKSFSDTTGQSGFEVVTTPDMIRCLEDWYDTIPNGGWHYSSCGSISCIQYKMQHVVCNSKLPEVMKDEKDIRRFINEGKIPFREKSRLCSVDVKRYLPEYVLQNIELYQSLITDIRSYRTIPFYTILTQFRFTKIRFRRNYKKIKHMLGKNILLRWMYMKVKNRREKEYS